MNELEIMKSNLVKVLHYDGTPITARFIVKAIEKNLGIAKTSTAASGSKELA
jgi:2-oxoglutarate ferredoxin oxidoreductase subunit alpha